jgi:hypothetical protein
MAEQTRTEYQPTTAEKKLLEVLLDPRYRMKSITDICSIAQIGRTTYYEAFSKPQFVEIYKQRSIELVKQQVAPVINAFVQEAKRGSFQHGKVLLEMADLYSEKKQLEHTGKDGGPIQIEEMSAEERAARIEELSRKLKGE